MGNDIERNSAEQIERIRKMESCLDISREVVQKLSDALLEYEETLETLAKLSSYYGSTLWMQDYEDDEAGRLPADLKRGVLSEDLVYNLLTENRELCNRMMHVLAGLMDESII